MLDKYLIDEEQAALLPQASQSQEQNPQETQALPARTGIDYWDNKKQITPFDAYLARKYNGVSFEGKLDIKTMSGTQTMKELYNTLANIDNINESVKLSQTESGVFTGLARKLNQLTGGFTPIGDKNAEFMVRNKNLQTTIANNLTNGRPTTYALSQAEATAGAGFKSKEQMDSIHAQSYKTELYTLKRQIAEAEAKNLPVDRSLYEYVIKLEAASDAIARHDYAGYMRIMQGQIPNQTTNQNQKITPYKGNK